MKSFLIVLAMVGLVSTSVFGACGGCGGAGTKEGEKEKDGTKQSLTLAS
jgi:hypothetical protein